MEFISENVSVEKDAGRLSVVISQKLNGWKKTLLVTWFLFWSLCGIYFVMALATEPSKETKLGIVVLLVFWAYYAWKIGKALMWRLRGMEQWRIKEGTLTVKDSINGYGKIKEFFAENIQKLGPMEIDEQSWKWQMSNSFWQIGGERIGFEYFGKRIAIGKGLSQEDAKRLAKQVSRALKDSIKQEN